MEIPAAVEDMSGSALLDHVGAVATAQRRAEVELLRAAYQHAVLHDPDTLDPAVARLPGRERAVHVGGDGTPPVAEFAAAELGARAGLSPYAGRVLIADALDLQLRFPVLWQRVQELEVKSSYARFVAKQCRELTWEQARYVDGRVAESADGRITWSRFELLVEAAIVAADPEAAREREAAAAEAQYANATRADAHGMRGFYVRAHFGVIARLDASVTRIAEMLAELGDTDPVDHRRVKAVLVLADPGRAAELLAAYAAWRDRPCDPDLPADPGPETDGPPERTGSKPVVDWPALLPTVCVYVHLYRGADAPGVARIEGERPVTEEWLRSRLGPHARFTIRPVLDLAGQAPVDAYEIPDRHRRAVHLTMPADTFPFASSLSPEKQVDHTVPYDPHGPPGQSRLGNYGPMTTSHHRVKTHGGWEVQQPFAGIHVWRDPHGAVYLVDHTGTRRITSAA